MTVKHPVERLEQGLSQWEQLCFILGLDARITQGLGRPIFPLVDPLLNYKRLRRTLLRSYSGGRIDMSKFIPPESLQEYFGSVYFLPVALLSWTFHSRRVFHLSDEIQVQLANTSTEGLTWSDIRWPLESFGIELEVPLVDAKGRSYDFILVSQMNGPYREIRLFPRELDKVYFLSKKEKEDLDRGLAKRQWIKTYERSKQIRSDRVLDVEYSFFALDPTVVNRPVDDSIVDMWHSLIRAGGDEPSSIEEHPEWDDAARIVVGLCMYLTVLRRSSPNQSEWVPAPSTPDPNAITRAAEVCFVSSIHPFHRDERAIVGGKSRSPFEMRTHWRQGYWRRPPGQGKNPLARRTIWIRPMLIRKDRLLKGAIPGGDISKMR